VVVRKSTISVDSGNEERSSTGRDAPEPAPVKAAKSSPSQLSPVNPGSHAHRKGIVPHVPLHEMMAASQSVGRQHGKVDTKS